MNTFDLMGQPKRYSLTVIYRNKNTGVLHFDEAPAVDSEKIRAIIKKGGGGMRVVIMSNAQIARAKIELIDIPEDMHLIGHVSHESDMEREQVVMAVSGTIESRVAKVGPLP